MKIIATLEEIITYFSIDETNMTENVYFHTLN